MEENQMAPLYKNIMEDLVEEKYDKMQSTLSFCTCPQCRADAIAYALNQLPPKYVVTPKGEIYSKTYALSVQHDADITSALAAAVTQIAEHPRH